MRHPLEQIVAPDARPRAVALLGALALLVALSMAYICRDLTIPGKVPQGIISFELAGDQLIAGTILGSWDPARISAARLSLALDYLFLALYSNAMAIACLWMARFWPTWPWLTMRELGVLLAWGQWEAGLADGLENYCLLGLLDPPGAAPALDLAGNARWLAHLKFILIEAGLIYMVVTALHKIPAPGRWRARA
jgi:hypothetical protein